MCREVWETFNLVVGKVCFLQIECNFKLNTVCNLSSKSTYGVKQQYMYMYRVKNSVAINKIIHVVYIETTSNKNNHKSFILVPIKAFTKILHYLLFEHK